MHDGNLSIDGVRVPSFLYGTAWKEQETQRLTELALLQGFRGIDTANQRRHDDEAAVDRAVAAAVEGGLHARNDLFLQTKFTFQRGQDHRLPYNPQAPIAVQVEQSFASSLEHLGTGDSHSIKENHMSRLTGFRVAVLATPRLVMAGAALVLAAVVLAGAACYPRSRAAITEASTPTGPDAGQDKPTVSYWHVWTDDNGVSHQKRCELSTFMLQSISKGAAPSWIDKQSTPGATVLVVVQPVGWVGEWHENPKPQWIVPLSGRWFVETMDGKRVEMGPGEVSFGGDQNTKPDAQGRKGHRSGTVGNQPSVNLIVQLEKDPFAGRPCGSTATSTTKPQLGPADTYFVTQTSLGTPFQVDSGRLAQKKGGTQAIRSYAELMVGSHITVNDALEAIVKRKAQVPPPTLLKAAYATMISTLAEETGQRLDADYVRGQVNYQKANAALYQYEIDNGTDPDLKAFAQQTLPKIQDHLERALKLERELKVP